MVFSVQQSYSFTFPGSSFEDGIWVFLEDKDCRMEWDLCDSTSVFIDYSIYLAIPKLLENMLFVKHLFYLDVLYPWGKNSQMTWKRGECSGLYISLICQGNLENSCLPCFVLLCRFAFNYSHLLLMGHKQSFHKCIWWTSPAAIIPRQQPQQLQDSELGLSFCQMSSVQTYPNWILIKNSLRNKHKQFQWTRHIKYICGGQSMACLISVCMCTLMEGGGIKTCFLSSAVGWWRIYIWWSP